MRPTFVLGASGFIGSHLVAALRALGQPAIGLSSSTTSNWRTRTLDLDPLTVTRDQGELLTLLDTHRPRVIFNLAAYGAYEWQTEVQETINTNLSLTVFLSRWATENGAVLIQAGSSSEYGINSNAPNEEIARPKPNSLYAVTKLGASLWLEHLSRSTDLCAVTLRIYSAFGPLEDPSRLIPTVVRHGLTGELPPLASPTVSRDFVYIDDVVSAFLTAAERAQGAARGRTLNVCTGVKTTMRDLADVARGEFNLQQEPAFGAFGRHWDLDDWVGDPALAKDVLGWESTTSLAEGLHLTRSTYESPRFRVTLSLPVDSQPATTVSLVVACYRDEPAIPHMYEQVRDTFSQLNYDFELIFVNDGSPDNTLQVVEELSRQDHRVIGINHSRNFGSQAAFLSGMRESTGEYVCLMDGDLQDPPAIIPQMLKEIEGGADVAFGERVGRDAPRLMRFFYRGFYRLFSRLASFTVPRDAGDFSLMRREVVSEIVKMPERGLFIRAQRAYVGFTQVGVPYHRPERMFGRSTNSFRKNFGWATKGLISSSRAPLTFLTGIGMIIALVSAVLIILQVIVRLFIPESVPPGLATVSILILGVGGFTIFCVSIVGLYVGRILDEVQGRPPYIQRSVTRNGATRRGSP